jgi:hypothetical protein
LAGNILFDGIYRIVAHGVDQAKSQVDALKRSTTETGTAANKTEQEFKELGAAARAAGTQGATAMGGLRTASTTAGAAGTSGFGRMVAGGTKLLDTTNKITGVLGKVAGAVGLVTATATGAFQIGSQIGTMIFGIDEQAEKLKNTLAGLDSIMSSGSAAEQLKAIAEAEHAINQELLNRQSLLGQVTATGPSTADLEARKAELAAERATINQTRSADQQAQIDKERAERLAEIEGELNALREENHRATLSEEMTLFREAYLEIEDIKRQIAVAVTEEEKALLLKMIEEIQERRNRMVDEVNQREAQAEADRRDAEAKAIIEQERRRAEAADRRHQEEVRRIRAENDLRIQGILAAQSAGQNQLAGYNFNELSAPINRLDQSVRRIRRSVR